MTSGARDSQPCRILLVDDDRTTRRLIIGILAPTGVEVAVATNGAAAVQMVVEARGAGEPFDVVLMDMQMPVLDGLAAARLLRDRDHREPIIALSARQGEVDLAAYSGAGCDDFIATPVERDRLIAAIEARLRGARVSASR